MPYILSHNFKVLCLTYHIAHIISKFYTIIPSSYCYSTWKIRLHKINQLKDFETFLLKLHAHICHIEFVNLLKFLPLSTSNSLYDVSIRRWMIVWSHCKPTQITNFGIYLKFIAEIEDFDSVWSIHNVKYPFISICGSYVHCH